MAQIKVVKRNSLKSEPKYNTTNENILGVQSCPINNEEKKPVQKITKTYFADSTGKSIDIVTEKEVFLCIETENMVGEEVIINLNKNHGDFKYDEAVIDNDNLLKVNISSNTEKIKLEVVHLKEETVKGTKKSSLTNQTTDNEAKEKHWNDLKSKHFPENDWARTEFETKGIDYEDFKADYPELHEEMMAKYSTPVFGERYLPEVINSGSDIPKKVIFNKGDKVYKIVPKGEDIERPSPYYLSEEQMKEIKNNPENFEQTLGLPLSSVSGTYDVFELTAKEDGISAFESTVAPTEQSGKPPQGSYETTGGGTQTLIIDNDNTDLWEKSDKPSESITP